MNDGDIVFLSAASATSAAFEWGGGEGLLSIWGTWNTATATVQHTPDGTTWLDVPGAAFSANGSLLMAFPPRKKLRVALATVGADVLSATLERTRR